LPVYDLLVLIPPHKTQKKEFEKTIKKLNKNNNNIIYHVKISVRKINKKKIFFEVKLTESSTKNEEIYDGKADNINVLILESYKKATNDAIKKIEVIKKSEKSSK